MLASYPQCGHSRSRDPADSHQTVHDNCGRWRRLTLDACSTTANSARLELVTGFCNLRKTVELKRSAIGSFLMSTSSIDLTPEDRKDLLRVRTSRKLRCLSQLPFVRRCEFSGCFRLWRRGGTYSYNRFFFPWASRVSTIYIRRPEYGDSDIKTLQNFAGIVAADFGDTMVTDCGILALAASKQTLQYLFLWGTKVGDGIVHFVENMPALRMLNISTQFIEYDTFLRVCDRIPECYVIHEKHGRMFRGLTGDDAMHAWVSDET